MNTQANKPFALNNSQEIQEKISRAPIPSLFKKIILPVYGKAAGRFTTPENLAKIVIESVGIYIKEGGELPNPEATAVNLLVAIAPTKPIRKCALQFFCARVPKVA